MRSLLPLLLSVIACGSPSEPAASAAAVPTPAAQPAPAATVVAAAPVAAPPVAASPSPAPAREPEVSKSPCPAGMTFVPGGEFKAPWSPKPQVVADLCVDTT